MIMNRVAYLPPPNEKESKPKRTVNGQTRQNQMTPHHTDLSIGSSSSNNNSQKCAVAEVEGEKPGGGRSRRQCANEWFTLANFLMMCHRWNFDVFFTSYKHRDWCAKFVHDVSWMWCYRSFVRSNENSMQIPCNAFHGTTGSCHFKMIFTCSPSRTRTHAASKIRLNLYDEFEMFFQPKLFFSSYLVGGFVQASNSNSNILCWHFLQLYFHQSRWSTMYTKMQKVWQFERASVWVFE